MTFTDLVSLAETRSYMGVSCFLITVGAIVINLNVMVISIIGNFKLLLKRHIARQAYKKHKKLMELFKPNPRYSPDLEGLRRNIIAVRVKAKKTSYLDAIKNPGKGKILPSMNQQQQLLVGKRNVTLRGPTSLEEEKEPTQFI